MYDFDIIRGKIPKNSYRRIGSGSGRNVYDLGCGYVVKAAKNERGLAQNKAEMRIAEQDTSNLHAKIMEASDDARYLIMERASGADSMTEIWEYFGVRGNRELYLVPEIRRFAGKYRLLLPDLGRASNWGWVRGRPVIIDYGFTRQVSGKYY